MNRHDRRSAHHKPPVKKPLQIAIHCPGLDAKGCGNTLISDPSWFRNQEYYIQCIRRSNWILGLTRHSEAGEFLDPLCESCGKVLVERVKNSRSPITEDSVSDEVSVDPANQPVDPENTDTDTEQ